MSLRTISRVVIVSTFALGALTASACGSSKKSSSSPSDGGSDASTTAKDSGAGGKDSGSMMMSTDSGTGTDSAVPTLMCGTQSCVGETVGGAKLTACCGKDAKNADACGIDLAPLGNLIGMKIPSTCSLRDQPGADSTSCGAVLEKAEPLINSPMNYANLTAADKMDMKLSINLAKNVTLSLPGCCLPSGQCGVVMNQVVGGNLHLGCNSLKDVVGLLGPAKPAGDGGAASADAGAPMSFPPIPCDPTSGMVGLPPTDGGAGDGGSTTDAGSSTDAGSTSDASADAASNT